MPRRERKPELLRLAWPAHFLQTKVGNVMATRSAEPLLVRILCSRYAGALAGVTLVTLFLGCMNVSLGGRTFQNATHDGSGCEVFVQEGDVTVPPGDQEVYYP